MDAARTLGQVIRSRRLALGLTQEELAERIGDGVRQAEVSRLERGGVALPRRRRMERIAAALKVPLGELLAATDWSGAGVAFSAQTPPTEAATGHSEPATTKPEDLGEQHGPPSMADLRRALARSQELHWYTMQLLNTSRNLVAVWDEARTKRPRMPTST